MGRMRGWPYDLHKATVEFKVFEHEDAQHLGPRIGIMQDLEITWDHDRKCWHAVGHDRVWNPDRQDYDEQPAEQGGTTWHGYAVTRSGAILDWLADRLALKEVEA